MDAPRPDRRAVLGAAAGGLLALAPAFAGPAGPAGPGRRRRRRPGWCAADRGGERVYVLDRDLRVLASAAVPRPVDLACSAAGEVFVLCAPRGRRELVRLSAEGAVRGVVRGRRFASLAADRVGRVLALEPGRVAVFEHGVEVGRVDAPGATGLAVAPGGRWLALAGDGALFAGDDEGVRATARLPEAWGTCSAVPALGGSAGGFWVLGDAGLRLLDRELETRADVATEAGAGAGSLLEGLAGDGVWVLAGDGRSATWHGPEGARATSGDWPLDGVSGGYSLGDGRLLLVAPGALFTADETGRAFRAGQGGFRELSALAWMPELT